MSYSKEEWQRRYLKEKEAKIATSPTIYKALEDKLIEEGLSYGDLEAITMLDVKVDGSHGAKILDRIKAKEMLEKFKLVNDHYSQEDGCNLPFYAYTKDRIFYLDFNDEVSAYWIGSIPRNPTDKEAPTLY